MHMYVHAHVRFERVLGEGRGCGWMKESLLYCKRKNIKNHLERYNNVHAYTSTATIYIHHALPVSCLPGEEL